MPRPPPFLNSLLPFLKGFTVFYWATGTWWIPMLLVLAVWRYVYKRLPLRYDPQYWGAVFPLGMYAVSTYEMSRAMGLGFLAWLAPLFLWIAIAAWSVTFTGLLRRLLHYLCLITHLLHPRLENGLRWPSPRVGVKPNLADRSCKRPSDADPRK